MNIKQITARLAELGTIRETLDTAASGLRLELATKQAELLELQRQITENTWENTDEYREYQELKTALAATWLLTVRFIMRQMVF